MKREPLCESGEKRWEQDSDKLECFSLRDAFFLRPSAKDQGISQVVVIVVAVAVVLFYLSNFLIKWILSEKNYPKPGFEPGTFSTL